MAKTSKLSNYEIGQKVTAGKNFWVSTDSERRLALAAASFAGKRVSSRKSEAGGFTVFFL